MADIIIRGFLDKIHYLQNQGGIMYVSEFKKGYKKSSGEYIEDRYISWRVLFKQGQSSYLNKHFGTGMLIKVKGEVLPFAIKQQNIVEGYTITMDSCVIDSYPRYNAKQEIKMIKESQLNSDEQPDLDSYNQPDF